jgi:predicted ATP-binding protein involved in virulence
MFLKRLTVENLGPIERFDIELPFDENGQPKPIILVGENGTGKSILLSLVVNSLIAAKQLFFDDSEVEQDRVYKLRSPHYISSNKHHYYARSLFEKDFECVEWQLGTIKKEFKETFGYTPTGTKWEGIKETDTSLFSTNFRDNETQLRNLISRRCLLYFPANRFEEPAWLNLSNLRSQAEYTDLERLTTLSNRRIVQYAPLKANQNWLMDILFDRNVLEAKFQSIPLKTTEGQVINVSHFSGYSGDCATIYDSILQVLKVILRTNDSLRFGFGDRLQRQVHIMRNEQTWIPNLFQLSTGEALVFDLFLTIIRDYDLTRSACTSLNEITGLVLVDEIELHLHSTFQYEVLPKLIKLFPQIQFIITSHSPLFLLGMQRALTEDGFNILEMPSGTQISTEEFAEFGTAYSCFKETRSHEEAIRLAVAESQKPILFMEGDYDIRYLQKAAQLLGKNDLLERFTLMDGGGFWKSGQGLEAI